MTACVAQNNLLNLVLVLVSFFTHGLVLNRFAFSFAPLALWCAAHSYFSTCPHLELPQATNQSGQARQLDAPCACAFVSNCPKFMADCRPLSPHHSPIQWAGVCDMRVLKHLHSHWGRATRGLSIPNAQAHVAPGQSSSDSAAYGKYRQMPQKSPTWMKEN